MENEKKANPVGRPSELPETIEKAKEYLHGGYETVGEVMPSVAGLACYCGKSRETMYDYQKQSSEFSDIVASVLTLQESKLLNNGVTGVFNATITKLLLTKHGYSERHEVDNKSSDGSMSPQPTSISFEVVDADTDET